MKKGRRGSYLLLREKTKPAITHFFAKSFIQDDQRYWLFALKPETGKTHQLRVAMKSLASPVLGDRRYENINEQAAEVTEAIDNNGLNYPERGYLHAYKMCFDLFGKRYEISDPMFVGGSFNLNDHLRDLEIGSMLKLSLIHI